MSKRLIISIAAVAVAITAVSAAWIKSPEGKRSIANVTQTSHRAGWTFGADGSARLPDGLYLQIQKGVTGVPPHDKGL